MKGLALFATLLMVNNVHSDTIGGHRDAHGCMSGAGYQWSVVLDDCVRVFENGIRLTPAKTQLDQTQFAFAIFSKDKDRVELFVPSVGNSIILEQKDNRWVGQGLSLLEQQGNYILKEDDVTIYQSQ